MFIVLLTFIFVQCQAKFLRTSHQTTFLKAGRHHTPNLFHAVVEVPAKHIRPTAKPIGSDSDDYDTWNELGLISANSYPIATYEGISTEIKYCNNGDGTTDKTCAEAEPPTCTICTQPDKTILNCSQPERGMRKCEIFSIPGAGRPNHGRFDITVQLDRDQDNCPPDSWTGSKCLEILSEDSYLCKPGQIPRSNGCEDAPAGKYATLGVRTATDCPAGRYINVKGSDNQDDCIKCVAGKYQDNDGQVGCIECDVGKYQDNEGQDSCKTCPTGYSSWEGSDDQDDCISIESKVYGNVYQCQDYKDCDVDEDACETVCGDINGFDSDSDGIDPECDGQHVQDVGKQVYLYTEECKEEWQDTDDWPAATPITHDECPYRSYLWSIGNSRAEIECKCNDGLALNSNNPVQVADINSGTGSSPGRPIVFKDKLYFGAKNDIGYGLWKSDGTEAGTVMVTDDIHPKMNTIARGVVFKDELYFQAGDDGGGDELWKSDGEPCGSIGTDGTWSLNEKACGTVMVKDIRSGPDSSSPNFLTVFKDELYFQANDGNGEDLWKSDGTADGTVKIKDINTYPHSLTVFKDELYFSATDGINGQELWKYDPENGAEMVTDINPGPAGSNPYYLRGVGDTLYFAADDGTHGHELWKSDGEPCGSMDSLGIWSSNTWEVCGTVMVADINPGPAGSSPTHLNVFDGALYFGARGATSGSEFWKSDGEPCGSIGTDGTWSSNGKVCGTVMVKDINPGGNSSPKYFTVYKDKLYFQASLDDASTVVELWKYDPLTDSTVMVTERGPSEVEPKWLTVFDGALYFSADELWVYHDKGVCTETNCGQIVSKADTDGAYSYMNPTKANEHRQIISDVCAFKTKVEEGTKEDTLAFWNNCLSKYATEDQDSYIKSAIEMTGQFSVAEFPTGTGLLWNDDNTKEDIAKKAANEAAEKGARDLIIISRIIQELKEALAATNINVAKNHWDSVWALYHGPDDILGQKCSPHSTAGKRGDKFNTEVGEAAQTNINIEDAIKAGATALRDASSMSADLITTLSVHKDNILKNIIVIYSQATIGYATKMSGYIDVGDTRLQKARAEGGTFWKTIRGHINEKLVTDIDIDNLYSFNTKLLPGQTYGKDVRFALRPVWAQYGITGGYDDNGKIGDIGCMSEEGVPLQGFQWPQCMCGDGDINGDEECDDGNDDNTDACKSDCTLKCGDGNKDADEECDDGNRDNTDACTNGCTEAICGDGIVRKDLLDDDADFEQCEDGNRDNTDACTKGCRLATCGDGFVRTDLGPDHDDYEECDDGGYNVDARACTTNCMRARCGDGIVREDLERGVTGYEECDDGNDVDTDACTNGCMDAICGDGIVREDLEPGVAGYEYCDDGNDVNTDACIDCSAARCGDGIVREDLDPGVTGYEECDDENDDNTDICAQCKYATCGDGFVQTGPSMRDEQCDDENDDNTDACALCLYAKCGDGFVRTDLDPGVTGYEECDAGENNDDNGACTTGCMDARCGDGIVREDLDPGVTGYEECDEGENNDDNGACKSDCTLRCGDGVIQAGEEECDDGNQDNTDACTTGCMDARCGDGIVRTDLELGDAGYEECDDGNQDNTDACTTSCKDAICGDGFVRGNDIEFCDTGGVNTGACARCKPAACGDGIVRTDLEPGDAGYEECDNGRENNFDNSACKSDCTLRCGDGDVDAGEQCDDGNDVDTDACTNGCTEAICGDGIVRKDLDPGVTGYENCDSDAPGCENCIYDETVPSPP